MDCALVTIKGCLCKDYLGLEFRELQIGYLDFASLRQHPQHDYVSEASEMIKICIVINESQDVGEINDKKEQKWVTKMKLLAKSVDSFEEDEIIGRIGCMACVKDCLGKNWT
ncbi:hypothetical protein Tco_0065407 [Tanacetum coccineum]